MRKKKQKKKKKIKESNWYSVKLLFESIISGEPEPDTIDINYTNNYKTFEESIILIKAQSFEHAYKVAEKKAKEMEIDYTNPYGEFVNWKFVDAIDCFSLSDEKLISGTELYSRYIRVSKEIDTEKVIQNYYPETAEEENEPDYNFVLRVKEFNARPNSEK